MKDKKRKTNVLWVNSNDLDILFHHESPEIVGYWFRLCYLQHKGSLPGDDLKLANALSITLNKWLKIKPVLKDFIRFEGDANDG